MDGTDVTRGSRCLIGHTGFVGEALQRQSAFECRYNSKTIADISGERFGTVVCAAAPGSMLEANTAPEKDRAQVASLIESLSSIQTDCFILVSSIAVLADFAGGQDEGTKSFQHDLAYGRHRRELEQFVESTFERSIIVRLPALFGHGLRKNFIFDLLNPVPSMLKPSRYADLENSMDASLSAWLSDLYTRDYVTGMLKLDRRALNTDRRRSALEQAVRELGFDATHFHNPDSTFQYYEIERLWSDIGVAMRADLSHIHLVSEPVRAADVHQRLMQCTMSSTAARLHNEDMRTVHAGLWGRSGPYQFDARTTLDRLAEFFLGETVPS